MRRPLLVAFALALALGVSACGGGETIEPVPETVEGEIQQETVAEGDAEAGRQVFLEVAEPTCGSCHTFAAAGTESDVGPNLDESLQGKDTQYIYESIVAPNTQIAEGFSAGIMPGTYAEDLNDKQLADLVAFLKPAS